MTVIRTCDGSNFKVSKSAKDVFAEINSSAGFFMIFDLASNVEIYLSSSNIIAVYEE